MTKLLLKKIESYLPLEENEQKMILALPAQSKSLPARSEIDTNPTNDGFFHQIESGFACRYKYLNDGRRQILSFLVPGDIVDLRQFIVCGQQPQVASLSPLSLSAVATDALLKALERFPKITRALWCSTLADESVSQEWLVNVGQRSALERMSHLLCELRTRLGVIGLSDDGSFSLPVTQNELADALGLSAVHVNRTLQELRRMELIVFHSGKVAIFDFEKLADVAKFSPSYLQFRDDVKPEEVS